MNLREAKLCNDCQEIFSGDSCPRCGCDGYQISRWIQPITGMGVKKVEIKQARSLPGLRLITPMDESRKRIAL